MNNLLPEHIPDAGIKISLRTRGGRTIIGQWQHIHRVRMQWLETCDQEPFKKYTLPGQENLTDWKDLHKMPEASFLKDEFSGLYDKAGASISRMLLPANNFLKNPLRSNQNYKKRSMTAVRNRLPSISSPLKSHC